MNKPFIALLAAGILFLGGCSVLEDVNNTVTYVNGASGYVSEVSTFIKEVPSLAEKAVNDKQTVAKLEAKLKEMKEEMKQFTELQAPDIAADLHQQMIEHTRKAREGIDLYLNKIKDGIVDPAVLENTGIFQSMQEITKFIDQIKQLGQ